MEVKGGHNSSGIPVKADSFIRKKAANIEFVKSLKMRISALWKRENLEKARILVSAGLCYWSVLLLYMSFAAISMAWMHAFRDNRIPEVWGTYEGNHGPWRHYYAGRELVLYAVIFPVKCIFYSVFSVLIKKSRMGMWLIVVSILVFFLIMYTHYWLID